MPLFIAPFSGNATGGGGHGYLDPRPQGTGVDTVGRTPLRLLPKPMNKHKPKRMNIVPPGMFRGALAPPYTWEPRERDDWRYQLPKSRSHLEAVDPPTQVVAPAHRNPRKPSGITEPTTVRLFRRGRGSLSAYGSQQIKVAEIHQELQTLRNEIHQLTAQRKQLSQKQSAERAAQPPLPKQSMLYAKERRAERHKTLGPLSVPPLGLSHSEGQPTPTQPAEPPPSTHWVSSAATSPAPETRSTSRSAYRLASHFKRLTRRADREAQARPTTKKKISVAELERLGRPPTPEELNRPQVESLTRGRLLLLSEQGEVTSKAPGKFDRAGLERLSGPPTRRDYESPEVRSISDKIQQKRARINELVRELRLIRAQHQAKSVLSLRDSMYNHRTNLRLLLK